MPADSNKLAGYIVQEMVDEFELGQSNEGVERLANALSRALSKFIVTDVEVVPGQQILGQGTGEVDVGTGTETVNTEVQGKTTTKGKLN